MAKFNFFRKDKTNDTPVIDKEVTEESKPTIDNTVEVKEEITTPKEEQPINVGKDGLTIQQRINQKHTRGY